VTAVEEMAYFVAGSVDVIVGAGAAVSVVAETLVDALLEPIFATAEEVDDRVTK
jgi:hypothetical protein